MSSNTLTSSFLVHLAHPIGRASLPARNFASTLNAFGKGRLTATYSAQWPLDETWQTTAGASIAATDWLILVFCERSLERDWWLWESGYFAASHKGRVTRTVCLHHPDLHVPRPLRHWRTVPATPSDSEQLLRDLLSASPVLVEQTLFADSNTKARQLLIDSLVQCCAAPRTDAAILDASGATST